MGGGGFRWRGVFRSGIVYRKPEEEPGCQLWRECQGQTLACDIETCLAGGGKGLRDFPLYASKSAHVRDVPADRRILLNHNLFWCIQGGSMLSLYVKGQIFNAVEEVT